MEVKIGEEGYQKIFNRLVKENNKLWKKCREKNSITKDLENDFNEFCKVMTETFEESPKDFSIKKVYSKIPKNTWVKKHACFIIKQTKLFLKK